MSDSPFGRGPTAEQLQNLGDSDDFPTISAYYPRGGSEENRHAWNPVSASPRQGASLNSPGQSPDPYESAIERTGVLDGIRNSRKRKLSPSNSTLLSIANHRSPKQPGLVGPEVVQLRTLRPESHHSMKYVNRGTQPSENALLSVMPYRAGKTGQPFDPDANQIAENRRGTMDSNRLDGVFPMKLFASETYTDGPLLNPRDRVSLARHAYLEQADSRRSSHWQKLQPSFEKTGNNSPPEDSIAHTFQFPRVPFGRLPLRDARPHNRETTSSHGLRLDDESTLDGSELPYSRGLQGDHRTSLYPGTPASTAERDTIFDPRHARLYPQLAKDRQNGLWRNPAYSPPRSTYPSGRLSRQTVARGSDAKPKQESLLDFINRVDREIKERSSPPRDPGYLLEEESLLNRRGDCNTVPYLTLPDTISPDFDMADAAPTCPVYIEAPSRLETMGAGQLHHSDEDSYQERRRDPVRDSPFQELLYRSQYF